MVSGFREKRLELGERRSVTLNLGGGPLHNGVDGLNGLVCSEIGEGALRKRTRRVRRVHRQALWRVIVAIALAAIVIGGFLTLHVLTQNPDIYTPPPDDGQ